MPLTVIHWTSLRQVDALTSEASLLFGTVEAIANSSRSLHRFFSVAGTQAGEHK